MKELTNLRRLRGRCHVSLLELEAASGLSNQYISCAELGKIPASQSLETRLNAAMEAIIADRKHELLLLEADFLKYRGRLLETAEENEHERDVLHTD